MTEEVKNYVRLHTRRGFEEDRRWKSGYTFKGIFDGHRVFDVNNSIWHEAASVIEVPEGAVIKEYVRTTTLQLSENSEWVAPAYRSEGYRFIGYKRGPDIIDITNDQYHNPANVKEI